MTLTVELGKRVDGRRLAGLVRGLVRGLIRLMNHCTRLAPLPCFSCSGSHHVCLPSCSTCHHAPPACMLKLLASFLLLPQAEATASAYATAFAAIKSCSQGQAGAAGGAQTGPGGAQGATACRDVGGAVRSVVGVGMGCSEFSGARGGRCRRHAARRRRGDLGVRFAMAWFSGWSAGNNQLWPGLRLARPTAGLCEQL